MVERITHIEMQAFRGVPGKFDLDLVNGRSCVVLGDNATGKSTIADAVEWYFTGDIDFLNKEGRSDAIRHSGASHEAITKVSVSTDGLLGGDITASELSPQSAREVGRSELFLLRGQTLADFINKTKGEKWRALAELLGLEAIDAMRLDLQHAKNELEDAERNARRELELRESAPTPKVGVVSESSLLAEFRRLCGIAQVEPPASLNQALTPRWRQELVPEGSSDQRAAELKSALDDLRARAGQPRSSDPIRRWNEFLAGAETAGRFRQRMYGAAKSLIDAGQVEQGRCPLCRQPTDLTALAGRIARELGSMEAAAKALEDAQQRARQFISRLSDEHRRRAEIRRRALANGVQLVELPASRSDALNQAVNEVKAAALGAVEAYVHAISSWDRQAIETLCAAIPAPATERDRALVEIGVLHSESIAWTRAMSRYGETVAAHGLAERVFSRYQQRQHEHFHDVIGEISGRVAEIYQFLHPESGIGGVAVETVGDKGAELSVEFHGKKELPPHRVLSESHLNSLGVALFLAMAETFNEELGFLVLDDVVNSFDREHRGRLAELLVDKFEDRQLIVLTHDEPFFARISVRAPAWVREHFTSWSYEDGPRTRRYASDRLVEEARGELEMGNRIQAAQVTRRALEEFLQEACEQLEALLPFRRGQANDQRIVDEVIRGLRRTLKDRAKAFYEESKDLLSTLEADLQAALNIESHASLSSSSSQEVKDALSRVEELRSRFTCQYCRTLVWHHGSAESARCKCGRAQFPPPAETSGAG